MQNSQFNYYLKEVLPTQFSNEKDIKKRAKTDINSQIKKTARILKKENEFEESPIEVKDLIKENRDDLLKLINNTFSRMDLLNDNKNEVTYRYYISVKELLELPDVKKTCDDFAKLYNVNINENIKSNKLRAINKKSIYNDNNWNKDHKYDIDNNLSKEKEEYGDIEYFSGGNALLGQKNENNNYILKNVNTNTYSNQFNYNQNQNQFINTNNNNVQNTNYSSFRTGPFPNTINQIEEKEEDPPFSSKIEGQGIIRDNNKKYIKIGIDQTDNNMEESKNLKPLINNINEEEAK